jgi:hypothetical protein
MILIFEFDFGQYLVLMLWVVVAVEGWDPEGCQTG